MILANERQILLTYLVADRYWDQHVKPATTWSDELMAIVRVDGHAHWAGPPNDEMLHGHPLASQGLRPYSVVEVRNSSLIASLEQMNTVHPHHDSKRFLKLRHFIFAFHDSTVECVGHSYEATMHAGSFSTAIKAMAAMLDGR